MVVGQGELCLTGLNLLVDEVQVLSKAQHGDQRGYVFVDVLLLKQLHLT